MRSLSLLGEALDILRRYGDVIGVKWDKAPGPLDRLPNLGVVNLASSPILAAAQVTIQGMKATTGSGEPQAGEAFEKSADLYEEAGDLLIDASVKDDQWNGTAANAYGEINDKHRHLTLEAAAADREMKQSLSRLAAQVNATRKDLQDAIDFLSDYDTTTSWMNAIPGGAAVKAAADMGVASTQLGFAEFSIARLVAESALVANEMRTPQGRYESAAGEDKVDPENTFPCGEPFGDERTGGQLPSRTLPNTPFTPPVIDGPPVIYPPATPYEIPAPR
ncbi:EspA/EspE family type VII secretion system effector [Mycolicibacterium sp. 624]|uniref:EspA/EspE family type VII secretion system effector n=1 Tax=Mycolicibacterium sp. 624 TaxID=3156314 RepID=UPI0033972083